MSQIPGLFGLGVNVYARTGRARLTTPHGPAAGRGARAAPRGGPDLRSAMMQCQTGWVQPKAHVSGPWTMLGVWAVPFNSLPQSIWSSVATPFNKSEPVGVTIWSRPDGALMLQTMWRQQTRSQVSAPWAAYWICWPAIQGVTPSVHRPIGAGRADGGGGPPEGHDGLDELTAPLDMPYSDRDQAGHCDPWQSTSSLGAPAGLGDINAFAQAKVDLDAAFGQGQAAAAASVAQGDYSGAVQSLQAIGQAAVGAGGIAGEIDAAGAPSATQPLTHQAWSTNALLAAVNGTAATILDAQTAQSLIVQMYSFYNQAITAGVQALGGTPPQPTPPPLPGVVTCPDGSVHPAGYICPVLPPKPAGAPASDYTAPILIGAGVLGAGIIGWAAIARSKST